VGALEDRPLAEQRAVALLELHGLERRLQTLPHTRGELHR
jgi:hypothetical protein